VEQDRGPRYEPDSYTHLNFNKAPKTYDEEKTASSTNVAGKSGFPPAKN
jgi:hypothetical protein